MTERPILIVLTKLPRVGVGKTRLARDLGRVEAWRINRALQALTFRKLADPRWRLVLCVAPRAALTMRLPGVWPQSLERRAQENGDLGRRIARAMGAARGPVGIVGTDCPSVSRAAAAGVFAGLKRARGAVGPALDGGFWMLALRRGRDARRLTQGVRWSSASTLADVEARLGKLAYGAPLPDVDDGADWLALRPSRAR